ncbi:MAG: exo-alpha-sialidase [Verrucomicrobia bacterium]|nr:exo-alpha-sialidase [Verrucomicrobiota bacterium]
MPPPPNCENFGQDEFVMNNTGSTLIARLVVLAIITILAAMLLPALAEPATGVEAVRADGKMGWATALPDGRLMAWHTEGKVEGDDPQVLANPDIPQKAFARYSFDNGRTWTGLQLLFEFPKEKGAYLGQMPFCDRNGTIHLFGLHFFGYDLKNFGNWDAYKSYAFHVMSTDGGKTWSAPQHCDFGYQYTGAVNSVIQLRSGRILLPVSYYSHRKTGRFVSNLSLSDDGGRTWRPSRGECVVDTGGGALESGACEPVVIELSDGRVWMLIRTQAGHQYEAFSRDDGDTWTEPVPSRFVSSNAPGGFLRLRDGRIVLAWNNCMGPTAVNYDRQVLTAAISRDDGKTWRGYREIARIAPGGSQVTYPYLTQAADGAIVVSYADSEWKGRWLRVRPDWLQENRLSETFRDKLSNWVTLGTEGVTTIPHPERAGAQVLSLRKPSADKPAGASLNFPFGAKGDVALKLRLQPGFEGCGICLTDFFSLPGRAEPGRFGVRIEPDGSLATATAAGQFQPTAVRLSLEKWHTLRLAWDCKAGACRIFLDRKSVGEARQLSRAPGVCYLRLCSLAGKTDQAGMQLESVETRVR